MSVSGMIKRGVTQRNLDELIKKILFDRKVEGFLVVSGDSKVFVKNSTETVMLSKALTALIKYLEIIGKDPEQRAKFVEYQKFKSLYLLEICFDEGYNAPIIAALLLDQAGMSSPEIAEKISGGEISIKKIYKE